MLGLMAEAGIKVVGKLDNFELAVLGKMKQY
jgi:hypothetical protein